MPNWRNATRWILYPWLFAIYPIVYLYSINISLVYDEEVLEAVGAMLLVTSVVFLILHNRTKNVHIAGAITSVCVIVFFTYGHIYNILDDTPSVQGALLPAMIVMIIILSGVILKIRAVLPKLAPSLNVISVFLLIIPLWQIGSYFFEKLNTDASTNIIEIERPSVKKIVNDIDHPDIYYIILDAYPSNDALLRDNGYDNSGFTDALEERGFYVAYDSRSNYDVTLVSLPSSLNMRYIAKTEGQGFSDHLPYLRSLLANSSVAVELQEQGYTYVYMLSGFIPPSKIADINIEFYPDGPDYFDGNEIDFSDDGSWYYKQSFWTFLLETTMLRSLVSQYRLPDFLPVIVDNFHSDRPYPWHSPDRFRGIFDELETIPEMDEATFTFVHIMKPHEPIRFDRDGNVIDYQLALTDEEYYYFEQLQYINTRTLEMIDHILEESSIPPIIIIQADHGSILGYGKDEDGVNGNFEILNAFYFPDGGEEHLYPSITPVNTFRLMLNLYFSAEFDLLEERFFSISKGYNDIFFQVEIVDDGRINVGVGDHIALIYNSTDHDGEPELHIYSVTEDGSKGDLIFAITGEDLMPYANNPPEQNTFIVRQGPIALYALDTGEFQFNIGPDEQGHEWAMVVDGLPTHVVYGFEVGTN